MLEGARLHLGCRLCCSTELGGSLSVFSVADANLHPHSGEAGQPLSEDSADKQRRGSGMLGMIRNRLSRRHSSEKDALKINPAAQHAVAAY